MVSYAPTYDSDTKNVSLKRKKAENKFSA